MGTPEPSTRPIDLEPVGRQAWAARSMAMPEASPEYALLDSIARWYRWMGLAGYADTTRETYRDALGRFLVRSCLDLRTATEDQIIDVLEEIATRGGHRGDMLRALKCYYRWAEPEIPWNPVRRLKVPRTKGQSPPAPFFDEDEEMRLLVAASWRHPRRAWCVLFALRTGARAESLCSVLRSDIAHGVVYFRVAKGDRPYSLPLVTADVRWAVEELLHERRNGLQRHDTLLGVGPTQLWSYVRDAALAAGLTGWTHKLRHTFGTRVYEATLDPVVTAKLLNHADLSQIPRYAHRTESEGVRALRAAFEK